MKYLKTIIVALSIILLASCGFHSVGPDDWKVKFSNTSTQQLDQGYRIAKGAGTTSFLDSATTVEVLGNVIYENRIRTLVSTPDGNRYILRTNIAESYTGKLIDTRYVHYLPYQSMVGRTIQEVRNEWGEELLSDRSFKTDGFRRAEFPQICQLNGDRYYHGVSLELDKNGIVTGQGMLHIQRNFFGKLPFYDTILSWNLLEYVRPPLYVDSQEEAREEIGIIWGTLKGTFWFLLVNLPLIILAFVFITPSSKGWVAFGLFEIVHLPFVYVTSIIFLNEYHQSWIILLPIFLFIASAPCTAYALYLAEEAAKCPKCGANNWSSDATIRDNRREIEYSPYPHITFGCDSHGQAYINNIERIRRWKVPMVEVLTCKKCGHVKNKYAYKEHTAYSSCINCGEKNIPYHFENVQINGRHYKATYVEECPKCGHVTTSNVDHVTQASQPQPRRRPQNTGSSSSGPNIERYPANCSNCYPQGDGTGHCHHYGKIIDLSDHFFWGCKNCPLFKPWAYLLP